MNVPQVFSLKPLVEPRFFMGLQNKPRRTAMGIDVRP